MPNTNHIYIHYPYCLYKCHYCDFNSYAYEEGQIPQADFTKTLSNELEFRVEHDDEKSRLAIPKGKVIHSVFFGGGTPSLMNPADVAVVLKRLSDFYTFADNIEITLETNPGTINLQKFKEFKEAGINRFSIGVQSFQEKNLKRFGRIHTGDQALQAIKQALDVNDARVSCDLIFGFPEQTLMEWQQDLNQVLDLDLNHFSCYSLMAEEGTIYTKALKDRVYQESPTDLIADMMEWTYDVCEQKGRSAYEVSNFAKPGFESAHNLGYWRYQSYMGLGPGAFSSFIQKGKEAVIRQMNQKNPQTYLRALFLKNDFYEQELIDSVTFQKERLMMGLRLKEGLELPEDLARQAVDEGLLESFEGRFRPTRLGFLQNNRLVEMFF